MSHLPMFTSTTTFSSSSLIFPPTSQTPTIHLEHNEHSGPDERSHCDDLRQCGSFRQTVTRTSYVPKVIETEAIDPEDVEPIWIEHERDLWTDPYHIAGRIYGDNYQNTITEDVKVPNPTMFFEKSNVPITDEVRLRLRRAIADSRCPMIENYEKCCLHHCMGTNQMLWWNLLYWFRKGSFRQRVTPTDRGRARQVWLLSLVTTNWKLDLLVRHWHFFERGVPHSEVKLDYPRDSNVEIQSYSCTSNSLTDWLGQGMLERSRSLHHYCNNISKFAGQWSAVVVNVDMGAKLSETLDTVE